MTDETDLLRKFVDESSAAAFRDLVKQRLGFVYAAALRQVGGDAHLAQEVAQNVFLDLARKARALKQRPTIAGWLFTSTRFAASKALRSRARRLKHETDAHVMNEILSASPATEPKWNELSPVLDAAMHELSGKDREAILLRYFDGLSLAEVGAVFGLAENSARMRVDRALEKLRYRLARRGITSTAAALGGVLSAQPVITVPAGLGPTVASASLAGAAAVGGGITLGMVLVAICAAVAIGIGAYSGYSYFSGRPVPADTTAPATPTPMLPTPAINPPGIAATVAVQKAASWGAKAEAPEYGKRAAYINIFCRFIYWPASAFKSGEAPIVIGVLAGESPPPIVARLELATKDQKGQGRPMEVRLVRTMEEAIGCHLLYIGPGGDPVEAQWWNALRGKPILTVGDSVLSVKRGAVLGFKPETRDTGGRLRFVVSEVAMKESQLRFSAALLGDAAEVFRSEN